MKLKKIVAIMSCTVLGVAIGSCSTKETTNETKPQATSTNTQSVVAQTQPNDTTKSSLKMNADASYVVGYQVGSGIARQDFGLYDKQTIAGFADAINGDKPRISESQIRRNMETLKDRMIKKQLDIAKLNKVKSD